MRVITKIGAWFDHRLQLVTVQHPFRGGVSPLHPVRSTDKNSQPHHGPPGNTKKPSLTGPESPHCRVQIGGGIGIGKRG
jgi:hypothetical protein